MIWRHTSQHLFCFALALILGGAIGNVIDRVVYGYVVDFIQVHFRWLEPMFAGGYFPAFNLADSAITVGAISLILDELFRVRKSK
jgi:signal peptidase II